jgi:hypothetical protein
VVFETVGDAVHPAVARPAGAVAAVLAGQGDLHREDWGATGPLLAMGLHWGKRRRTRSGGRREGRAPSGCP